METIENYEDYYVTTTGRVYSTKSKKFLKPVTSNRGYNFVTLFNDYGKQMCYIHQLVANTYLENPKNKPAVNHIDGDKLNNNLENLEFVTYSENIQHAYKLGLKSQKKGEDAHRSKLTDDIVREIIRLKREEGYANAYLGNIFNVNANTIYKIVNGLTWKHLQD